MKPATDMQARIPHVFRPLFDGFRQKSCMANFGVKVIFISGAEDYRDVGFLMTP